MSVAMLVRGKVPHEDGVWGGKKGSLGTSLGTWTLWVVKEV